MINTSDATRNLAPTSTVALDAVKPTPSLPNVMHLNSTAADTTISTGSNNVLPQSLNNLPTPVRPDILGELLNG
jgi:hypothetical protein